MPSLNQKLRWLIALATSLCMTLTNPDTTHQAWGEDRLVAGFENPPDKARPSAYWLWLNGYLNRDHVETELTAFHDAGIRGVCIFDMGARGDKAGMPPAGPSFLSKEWVANLAHVDRIAKGLGMDMQLSAASSWDMGGDWVEPRHASMSLVTSELAIDGPATFDDTLPFPTVPARTPRGDDGLPVFFDNSAVLAIPANARLPGHDFVFRLDPKGVHRLTHAVLHNTPSDDPKKYGEQHLYCKDFTIAVSTTSARESDFQEVFTGTLEPTTKPQRFELGGVEARYVRLRLLNGYNQDFDRIQLGEFELFDEQGRNLVASHEADRTRDGADLIGAVSALGQDRTWSASNIHDGSKSGASGSWSSAGPPPLRISETRSIVDLTERVDKQGRLRWNVPEGKWIIKRYVCTNTGETLKVPSPNSNGLATDHFSREATRVYLDEFIQRLTAQMGDLSQSALKQLYLASYEVRGAVWTPEMREHFRRFRGYDMTPYLPALTGDIVVNDEITQRFLYDYRKTLGDLLVDAYYSAAVDATHAAGMGIESEAGGPGPPIHQVPVDALKAQGTIDEIRGEFWPKRPDAHALWVVKETACAGHIYGKNRIHMEAFTSMHHWQDGPFDLKPSADRAFCEGMNHVVWHTSSHLPPEAGKPGWVYLAGTHLNTNLVWWPKAKPFLDYLSRCSYMLQQGLFVGDVCYYYGDQGFNFVPPKHVDPSLGEGYDYDVTNADVILNRMSVNDGRIALPDGMSYAVLALPDREDMDLDVLKKLKQLVAAGATVVGPKPTRANGLAGYPESNQAVRQLADELWGPCDGITIREHDYGKGKIIWGKSLREVLEDQSLGPDFSFTSDQSDAELDFIHRHSEDAEIYFVSNKRDRSVQVEAAFRVSGRTPELWDPVSGSIRTAPVYHESDGRTALSLGLPPNGSIFVVFRKDKQAAELRVKSPHADAVDAQVAIVESWDGTSGTVTAFRPGEYTVSTGDNRTATVKLDTPLDAVTIEQPWDVEFSAEQAAIKTVPFEDLISWTAHPDHDIKHFSGIAAYKNQFRLEPDWLADDRRVFLDLGELWSVAEVYVNDKPLGVLWCPPYRVEITEAAVVGNNRIVVEVANTWSNRLVGDAGLPVDQRTTRTNVERNNNTAWKDTPLLKSGLFGPVRLVPAVTRTIQPREGSGS